MVKKRISPVQAFYEELENKKAETVVLNKRGRPRKSKMYFTQTTEEAIVAYNLEYSHSKKERIYNE